MIERLWNGDEAWAAERSEVVFALEPGGLSVEITAKFHHDQAPAMAPGRTDRLWEYEVVELFLANKAGHYLELEFSPHGHYLALQFSGVRQAQRTDIPVAFQAEILGDAWRGAARVEASCLPANLSLANAYAIHGQGQGRRHMAAYAVPGPRPDFHQPQFFQPW